MCESLFPQSGGYVENNVLVFACLLAELCTELRLDFYTI